MGTPLPPVRVSRRSVLAGGTTSILSILGTFALGTSLTACSAPSVPQPARTPQPDDEAVARAVATAQQLRADALRLADAHAAARTLADQLGAAVADHTAHLAALGSPVSATRPAPAASSAAATGRPAAAVPVSPSPVSTAGAAPAGTGRTARTPADQLAAEWAGAREALRDAIGAQSAGLVALLARIATARAVHADLLATVLRRPAMPKLTAADAIAVPSAAPGSPAGATPSGAAAAASPASSGSASATGAGRAAARPTGEPAQAGSAWLTALDRLLAGEHAAVFAYPMVIVQLSGAAQAQAQAGWREHQASRNELTELLVRSGVTPVAAAAAYQVVRPATAATARKLAAVVESGLAGLAGDAVVASAGIQQRTFAAQELITAGRRSAHWSGRPTALPGLSEPVATPWVSPDPEAT